MDITVTICKTKQFVCLRGLKLEMIMKKILCYFLATVVSFCSLRAQNAQWELQNFPGIGISAGIETEKHDASILIMKLNETNSLFLSYALSTGDNLYKKGESLCLCFLAHGLHINQVVEFQILFKVNNDWKKYSFVKVSDEITNSLHVYYYDDTDNFLFIAPNIKKKNVFWADFKNASVLRVRVKNNATENMDVYDFDMTGSTRVYNLVNDSDSLYDLFR